MSPSTLILEGSAWRSPRLWTCPSVAPSSEILSVPSVASTPPPRMALTFSPSMSTTASMSGLKMLGRFCGWNSARVIRRSAFAPVPGSTRLSATVPLRLMPLFGWTAESSSSLIVRRSPIVPLTFGLSSVAARPSVTSGVSSSAR